MIEPVIVALSILISAAGLFYAINGLIASLKSAMVKSEESSGQTSQAAKSLIEAADSITVAVHSIDERIGSLVESQNRISTESRQNAREVIGSLNERIESIRERFTTIIQTLQDTSKEARETSGRNTEKLSTDLIAGQKSISRDSNKENTLNLENLLEKHLSTQEKVMEDLCNKIDGASRLLQRSLEERSKEMVEALQVMPDVAGEIEELNKTLVALKKTIEADVMPLGNS